MTDLYAVMGNPINHSKSPQIHTAFAQGTHQDLVYSAMLVPKDGFDSAVKDFFKGSGRGLNITVPFKESAYSYATQLSERAKTAGAVNTLIQQEDGSVLGDNTDGMGLVRDLTENLDVQISGRRILLLGAGGAARGVLQPLLDAKPEFVVVANRTHDKAQALAEDFTTYGPVRAEEYSTLRQPFDVIINATSASLNGELPPLSEQAIASHTMVYDMMYSSEPTAFMSWASQSGAAKTFDGLGMLVEQAAESFYLWRSVRPDTKIILSQLRAQLKSQ